MGEEGGIGFPHPTPTTHTPLLPTHPHHPLLSACHPACPPTRHPTAVEETTCNRTSTTFSRTTKFPSRLHHRRPGGRTTSSPVRPVRPVSTENRSRTARVYCSKDSG